MNRLLALAAASLLSLSALTPLQAQTSDNGDGTFTNPVMWSDCPDPDVIRVGDDYYLVTTTMHLMPGAPIMHSKDLVNWKLIKYLFPKLTDTPKYDMQGGTVYGRGQWATSLRYKNGKFYAYFSPNDAPYRGYVYTATDPAGEWTLETRTPHFHDASLFFDDDGRNYIFYGTGEMAELNDDLSDIKPGTQRRKVFERDETENGLLEGSRVIKHDGKYYLIMISWPRNEKRRQVCYRADKIDGPYEKKIILLDNYAGFPWAAQGTIVDDPKGNWYGFIFQDRGAIGRVPLLMPVRWVDGWPMMGDENGKVPAVMRKPVQGCTPTSIVESDDFSGKELKLTWQWNHNPVDEAWSLTERPGYLRLKTGRLCKDVFDAPNTISQRMTGPRCSGVVALDIARMKDGDVAGLSAFNGDAAVLSIEMNDGKKQLVMSTDSLMLEGNDKKIAGNKHVVKETVKLGKKTKQIWLRLDGDFRLGQDIATLYYSLDGKLFKQIGTPFKMKYDYRRVFMGSRFAIFNYATKQQGGYVDVDSFEYKDLK